MDEGETSLALTPTWALATVLTVLISFGYFLHGSLKRFGKWLDQTKRNALLSALDKIKEELMLFGLLSLLMGHWILFVAKICVKTSYLSRRFYPCAVKGELRSTQDILISTSNYKNVSLVRDQVNIRQRDYCPEGHESFASFESLEQLHRLMFVLVITHTSYSFIAVVLGMIKIYSWRTWENQAKSVAIQIIEETPETATDNGRRITRLSTFISRRTSHPWSQHKVLVWLLCFSRQLWSSINQADYKALRLGFITTHQLPLTYDFLSYMLRSMEEEFRDVVGISVPLWIYAICCIVLDFHGTDVYFWLSFIPPILILLISTKLHRVVVKLATEIQGTCPRLGNHQINLRDGLFWFGKPRLLLRLMQFISFQNAFEMATFLWSLWEIKDSSCFMDNRSYIIIRLTFGVVTQFWCSFITFPLYVIVTQMGAKFKKTILSDIVRKSLHRWLRRVKARHASTPFLGTKTTAIPALTTTEGIQEIDDSATSCQTEGSTLRWILDNSSFQEEEVEASAGPLAESAELSSSYSMKNDSDIVNDVRGDDNIDAEDGTCLVQHPLP